MQVHTRKSQAKQSLTQKQFLAGGGEGDCYRVGDLVYKINHAGKLFPIQKFDELSVLTDPHIIRPIDLVLSDQNKEIGYTMQYKDGFVLIETICNAFWNRHKLNFQTMLDLVHQMRQTTQHIHDHNITVVDYNEMNFLISQDFRHVWFIDTNSYQTPSFPATVLMESVRDRHHKGSFGPADDWFGFAIVTFEMLIGLHPYRGRHPNQPAAKLATEWRMQHNLSVLNPAVQYNQNSCRDIRQLPTAYLEWYRAVFEQQKRLPPPDSLTQTVQIQVQPRHLRSARIEFIQELELAQAITSVGYDTEWVADSFVFSIQNKQAKREPDARLITLSPHNIVQIWEESPGVLHYKHNQKPSETLQMGCDSGQWAVWGNRLYLKNQGNLIRIDWKEVGSWLFPAPTICQQVAQTSTKLYDHCIVENLLGSVMVSVFCQDPVGHQVRIPKLKGCRVISARYRGRVLILLVEKVNQINRMILRWSSDMSHYDCQTETDVDPLEPNFAVLNTGLCVLNLQTGIRMFWNSPQNTVVTQVDDPVVDGVQLESRQSTLLGIAGNKLYRLKLNK